jgi:hypothetical protein
MKRLLTRLNAKRLLVLLQKRERCTKRKRNVAVTDGQINCGKTEILKERVTERYKWKCNLQMGKRKRIWDFRQRDKEEK